MNLNLHHHPIAIKGWHGFLRMWSCMVYTDYHNHQVLQKLIKKRETYMHVLSCKQAMDKRLLEIIIMCINCLLTMQITLKRMVTKIFSFFKALRLGLGVKRPGVRLRSESSILIAIQTVTKSLGNEVELS